MPAFLRIQTRKQIHKAADILTLPVLDTGKVRHTHTHKVTLLLTVCLLWQTNPQHKRVSHHFHFLQHRKASLPGTEWLITTQVIHTHTHHRLSILTFALTQYLLYKQTNWLSSSSLKHHFINLLSLLLTANAQYLFSYQYKLNNNFLCKFCPHRRLLRYWCFVSLQQHHVCSFRSGVYPL